ncbi:MAG: glycosyltransferase [Chloroflexi bacterium]|nr:glycosyltransferase [Chloroflexota bacterium]
MSLRVLFVNYELPPIGAGAGNATANIARCLASAGVDMCVLTAAFKGLPRIEHRDGYLIYRAPAIRRRADQCSPAEMLSFTLGGMPAAMRLLRRWRPDAVCAFFGMPSGPIALLLHQVLGMPYVVSLRGGDVPGFMGSERVLLHKLALPVIRTVWHRSTGLLANSTGLADLARKTWPDAPITIIPNGVDVDTFAPPNRIRPETPLRLLAVGRLAQQKRFDTALAALALSRRAVVLRLVGDGPERAELERLTRALRIADRVEFAGWAARAELLAHYQWADALVLPSAAEGMSNVVLEALACGLPVVASDVIGNRDLIENEHNGYLVAQGDPGMYAEAIDRLAGQPRLVRQLGQRARSTAEDFRWENVAEQYRRVLVAAAHAGDALPRQYASEVRKAA